MKEKYYLTTAIPYTSRKPHIGNTYELIFTDAIARYKRMCGYDVFMLTDTDEHGQKIEDAAKEAGITLVDAGHFATEWPGVKSLYQRFLAELPALEAVLHDHAPYAGAILAL